MARIRPRESGLSHNALLESRSVLRRAIRPFSGRVPRASFIRRWRRQGSVKPGSLRVSARAARRWRVAPTIRSLFVLVHTRSSTAFVCHADELLRSRL